MGIETAIGAGASLLGGAMGSSAASKAANAQVEAARIAAQTQMNMFNRSVKLQEPFRQAGLYGKNMLLTYLGMAGGNPNDKWSYGRYRDPGLSLRDFQADPGYNFRQQEGMKALERSAAARGMALSGPMLKGIQRFSQDLASQEYTNAFNRHQVERNAALNQMQSLMGAGQTTSAQLGNQAMQTGSNIAQTQMAAGTARASGYMGSANAMMGGLSGAANAFAQQPLYNAMANYYSTGASGGSSGDGGYADPSGGDSLWFNPTYFH